jgi:hypothetical protein
MAKSTSSSPSAAEALDASVLAKIRQLVLDAMKAGRSWHGREDATKTPAFAEIAAMSTSAHVHAVLAAKEIAQSAFEKGGAWTQKWYRDVEAGLVVSALCRRSLPWTVDQLTQLVQWWIAESWSYFPPQLAILAQLEAHAGLVRENPALRVAVEKLHDRLGGRGDVTEDTRRICDRLCGVLGLEPRLWLDPLEPWAARVLEDLASMPPDVRATWRPLLVACADASDAAPTARWLRDTEAMARRLGNEEFTSRVLKWFPLVDKPRAAPPPNATDDPRNHPDVLGHAGMDTLKGLAWLSASMPSADLARALARLAQSSYRKVPGIGPRAVRVGNAAVHALGQMPGMDSVGQLAMLQVKVKFGSAQKGIEKALTHAAKRAGLPREEIEELGVPTYGMEAVGRRTETMGDVDAELVVAGFDAPTLSFIARTGAKAGKRQASVPAAVKRDHPELLKELKSSAKDIGAMLSAQRDRIDSMFLDDRSWTYDAWRSRYIEHPLIGVIARRLIWRIHDAASAASRAVTWIDAENALADVDGTPQQAPSADATVRLWHPIDASVEETLAWRRFFEDREIRQPFKQAHREVYLLTDAERATRTYSNRFAAHIVRQHQFNALCLGRGWKNKLRLMVDDEYPPASRTLKAHGLRAEFWVEGAGDQFGADTNESGVYLHLATDQVRFYPLTAPQVSAHASGGGYGRHQDEASVGLALEEIPPLVLSEILRDVDLFVGVASIGNNPQWSDGGPQDTVRDYWTRFSFGDLTETGKGRRDLLERLIPRLAIASACSFSGNYLVVRGSLRTYRIHLGSGNILMEPNDQYLCIVPSSAQDAKSGASTIFLPFEGDRTLSIILSKAFLLAADREITDPTITRQIDMA